MHRKGNSAGIKTVTQRDNPKVTLLRVKVGEDKQKRANIPKNRTLLLCLKLRVFIGIPPHKIYCLHKKNCYRTI